MPILHDNLETAVKAVVPGATVRRHGNQQFDVTADDLDAAAAAATTVFGIDRVNRVTNISFNGLPDLFLSGLGRSQLFRNQGDGTFRDVSREAGLGRPAVGSVAVVWDIDDAKVGEIGRLLGGFPFVTLCYRRPRRLPEWPYNLFTMIHGRDRDEVLARIDGLAAQCGLSDVPRDVLFSQRRFKQRGAHYDSKPPSTTTGHRRLLGLPDRRRVSDKDLPAEV